MAMILQGACQETFDWFPEDHGERLKLCFTEFTNRKARFHINLEWRKCLLHSMEKILVAANLAHSTLVRGCTRLPRPNSLLRTAGFPKTTSEQFPQAKDTLMEARVGQITPIFCFNSV